jgi:thioesterase domain-containing protein/acyl carrier protein
MSCESGEKQTSRRALATRLAEIWCRTLNVSPIEPDSNFFDLGGDSLLAVGMFLEIERETGINLPITTIYDAPTVAELADILAGEIDAPNFSPLVLLKPGDDGVPLFIVHGIGGTVMELSALGRAIRIPAPVYALQAQGLDGNGQPLASVDDMVELYLDHVRRLQPEGPYRLAGYSFGGLVALEMARRLMRQGQETAILILIDAYAHPNTWPLMSRLKMRVRRSFHLGRQYLRAPLYKSVPAVLARLRDAHNKDAKARLRDWLFDQNPDLPAPLLRVREAGSIALSMYVPIYYPGKIVFLKASRPDPEFPDDPERIWSPLVAGMEIHIVPGRHRTMVTNHPDALADRLSACVLAARATREWSGASSRESTPTNKPCLEHQAV